MPTKRILSNYEFKKGRKVVIQGCASLAKHMVVLGESVILQNKYMGYSQVEYEGEKDLFKL